MKKLLVVLVGGLTALIALPLFSAFEAHVINVSATIENALFVHPQSLEYGTVFPQEHLNSSFFLAFSESFSASDQRRVGTVEYAIKQKPKPRPEFLASQPSAEAARDWCHLNSPAVVGDPSDSYYSNCYPSMCAALSKHPDNNPAPGNDTELPAFHDPETEWATGKIVKFNASGSTINNDPADTWTIDLAVPCFQGQCAQDWDDFVLGLNPNATAPEQYQLPAGLEHQVFGCDLWVEVTDIH